MAEKIPLVSVIIPMYNAEKFIAQTLESLLYQTMTDFEVVVVNDCSTDNSVEVVESFAEKFNGRLHIINLPENSGGASLPRNVGIPFAHGKYIAFLDSDDLFTTTALEEFTTLAEKFQADVINTNEFFVFEDRKISTDELLNTKNHQVISCRNAGAPRLQEAVAVPENIAERIKLWLNNDFHWAVWATFVRRDFLIVNQIRFPTIPTAEDMLFNFKCFCSAKKLLRVPNITCIYRIRHDSITHDTSNLEKYFHKWLGNLNLGFNEFDKVMRRFTFFDEHPDYRYAVLDWFFERTFRDARQFQAAYAQLHPAVLNQLVQKEFHPDDAAFSAFLFDKVNIYQLQILKLQAELRKFQQQ